MFVYWWKSFTRNTGNIQILFVFIKNKCLPSSPNWNCSKVLEPPINIVPGMEEEAWAGTLTLSQYFVQLMRWMEEVFKIDMSDIVVFLLLMHFMLWSQVSRLSDRPYRRKSVHKLFYTLHPCYFTPSTPVGSTITWRKIIGSSILSWICLCLNMLVYSFLSILNVFTPSTPVESIITWRKIFGSSCPDNMHIYKWQWNMPLSFKSIW